MYFRPGRNPQDLLQYPAFAIKQASGGQEVTALWRVEECESMARQTQGLGMHPKQKLT